MTDRITKSTKSQLSLLLRIGIAAAACWIIYREINPAEVADKFRSTSIWMLIVLASAVFTVEVGLIGLRWWIFLRAQDIRVPAALAIKLTYLGQFFSNFMPSAVGGDVIRAWYVSRHITQRRLQAALGVIVDRIMGLIATLLLALTGYFLFMRGQGLFQPHTRPLNRITAVFDQYPVSTHQVLLSLVILAGVVLVLSGRINLWQFFKRIYGHILHLISQFQKVILVYYHYPLVLTFGLFLTILLQSVVILSLWLVGRGLGITAPLQFYFVFFPIVWTIGSIPISIAGIGILEGGIVFLFVQFAGANSETAIALALCQRLTWIVASIPGLLVHLSGSHRHNEQSC